MIYLKIKICTFKAPEVDIAHWVEFLTVKRGAIFQKKTA